MEMDGYNSSLYNESLMDFSVRGKSSTALEFYIEKPHWVK